MKWLLVPLLATGLACAQGYPARPLRVIVPFPPGGGTDATARIITQALAETAGWQLVIENRPGATGRIGTEFAARAPADGYTLLLGTAGPNVILPSTGVKLPYDAIKDFAPVTLIDSADYVLVIHPSLPVHSVKDLVAAARARPGQIAFASASCAPSPPLAQNARRFFRNCRRSLKLCPVTKSRNGSACSHPREHRARSSHNCTPH